MAFATATFNTPGTYSGTLANLIAQGTVSPPGSVPDINQTIDVTISGADGGGEGGFIVGGGGGAGGGFGQWLSIDAHTGTWTVVVGAGGSQGSSGAPGGSGGISRFYNSSTGDPADRICTGGTGGGSVTPNIGGDPGGSPTGSNLSADFTSSGGKGADGDPGGTGGGGGGRGTVDGDGSSGTNPTGGVDGSGNTSGGDGGASTVSGQNGNATNGGGGGGGGDSASGGIGRPGKIVITFTIATSTNRWGQRRNRMEGLSR